MSTLAGLIVLDRYSLCCNVSFVSALHICLCVQVLMHVCVWVCECVCDICWVSVPGSYSQCSFTQLFGKQNAQIHNINHKI